MNFSPFPTLLTDNLILREMTTLDQVDLFTIRSNPLMHEYTDTLPDETIEQTKDYIEKMREGTATNRWIIWAIEHRASSRVIGTLGIWNIDEEQKTAELSYGLSPAYQGMGYMREALTQAIHYGFDHMKLAAIEAYTEEQNQPSRRLLEKLNFQEFAHVNDVNQDSGHVYHMIVYRLEHE